MSDILGGIFNSWEGFF